MKRETKPRENCIVCEKKIYRGGSMGSIKKYKRPKDSITCSPKHAKIFQRIASYVWNNYGREKKKEGRKS